MTDTIVASAVLQGENRHLRAALQELVDLKDLKNRTRTNAVD